MIIRPVAAFVLAVASWAAGLAAQAAPPLLKAAQEAVILRAAHASYGADILNPAVARIEPVRQADGEVTAVVYFEPHSTEGRRTVARMIACRSRVSPDDWYCGFTWEETRISLPGQREPARMLESADDAVIDAVIGYVRGLPAELLRPLDRRDFDVISGLNIPPWGRVAEVSASRDDGSVAYVSVALCDPVAFSEALARASFRHPGARAVCGLRDEELPRTAAGPVRLADNSIEMPTDGSFLLVHHDGGYAALRVLDIREVERTDTGRPVYGARVEALYSADGRFEGVPAITTETTSDDAQEDDSLVDLPGARLYWQPSLAYFNIADYGGVVAATRTDWRDQRLLDVDAPSLDWYYLREDREKHVWSAQHLPSMRLMTCARLSGPRPVR